MFKVYAGGGRVYAVKVRRRVEKGVLACLPECLHALLHSSSYAGYHWCVCERVFMYMFLYVLSSVLMY